MLISGGGITPLVSSPTCIKGGQQGGWMLTNAMLFEKELRRLIDEEIERLKENMTSIAANVEGMGSITFNQGAIYALRGITDLISVAKLNSDQSSR